MVKSLEGCIDALEILASKDFELKLLNVKTSGFDFLDEVRDESRVINRGKKEITQSSCNEDMPNEMQQPVLGAYDYWNMRNGGASDSTNLADNYTSDDHKIKFQKSLASCDISITNAGLFYGIDGGTELDGKQFWSDCGSMGDNILDSWSKLFGVDLSPTPFSNVPFNNSVKSEYEERSITRFCTEVLFLC